jgi:prepilin-type N-terminal cleavage/methylation domain-containing protein
MDNVYNRMSQRRRKGQGGFTLIELLVVIAVLAVLAGIVIFNVTGVANKGKSSACVTDKQTIQTAVDAYYNDHNSTYPASGANVDSALLVSTNYIHSAPPETFALDTTSGTVSGGGC